MRYFRKIARQVSMTESISVIFKKDEEPSHLFRNNALRGSFKFERNSEILGANLAVTHTLTHEVTLKVRVQKIRTGGKKAP